MDKNNIYDDAIEVEMTTNAPIQEEFKYFKKLDNKSFYIIAFLVSLILFFFLSSVFQAIFIVAFEVKTPGFIEELQTYMALGDYSLLSDQMWASITLPQFLGNLTLIVLLLVLLGKSLVADFKKFRKDWLKNIGIIILSFGAILVGMNLIGSVYELLGIEGSSNNQELINYALSSSTKYYMMISIVLFAPLLEELIFRKLLFGLVETSMKLSGIVAVIISSVVFAALHIDFSNLKDLVFIFQYLFLAGAISFSYYKFDRNIYIPIGIHFLNNFLSLLVILFL